MANFYASYPFEGGSGGGGAPTGPAGGDLGGTYPNPTVISVADVTTGTLGVSHGGTGSTSFTAGSIPYSNGTILTQDNANLNWNDSTGILTLGALSNTSGITWNSGHAITIKQLSPVSGSGNNLGLIAANGVGATFPGGNLSLISGNGGTSSSASTAGNGGELEFTSGNGGNNSSTGFAGSGGSLIFTSGSGGNSTIDTAGDGGVFEFQSGSGGNSTTGTAGDGSEVDISGGGGGDASSSGLGGAGGAVVLFGGSGGSSGSSSSGNGGSVYSYGGAAGSISSSFISGGGIYLLGGTGSDGITFSPVGLNVDDGGDFGGLTGIGIYPPTAQLHVQDLSASVVCSIIQGAVSQSADLTEWQNSSSTVLAKVDKSGNITAPTFNSTATQTTLTGSAGTAVCSQPFEGSSYKKVIVYLNGYTDTSTHTYTYPVAFSHTPYAYGLVAGVSGATVTTTTVTFTVTTQTGFVIIEGY